jgi:Multiubiquitin
MEQQRATSKTYDATVNHRVITFADPVPDGRQILSSAGFDPADEHVLIERLRHGTRSIGLDETVDLRQDGREAFAAFRSDRIFRFTLDGRGYEWGAPTITEAELRDIAGLGKDEVLVLELADEKDRELAPRDQITLSAEGTERLHTAKRLVTVYIDGTPKKIARGVYTTEQLIAVLGVQPGYLLNVVNEEGQLVTLQPGQHLRVREGMKFFSQVPCGGSS